MLTILAQLKKKCLFHSRISSKDMLVMSLEDGIICSASSLVVRLHLLIPKKVCDDQ